MKEFLTLEQRSHLKLRHRSERDGRTRDRIKAVLLSDRGWTYRQIAEALLLDEETISKHVNEFIENNKLSIQTGGSVGKLNRAQTEHLIEHLTATTYVKVSDICLCICNV
jgi:predicted ArsR family transcriptional regulator